MFAGIDDEQAIISSKDNAAANNIISGKNDGFTTDIFSVNIPEKTIQTKAAVKDTDNMLSTNILNYKLSLDDQEAERDNIITPMCRKKQFCGRNFVETGLISKSMYEDNDISDTKEIDLRENEILPSKNNVSDTKSLISNLNVIPKKSKSLGSRKHVSNTKKDIAKSKIKKKKMCKYDDQDTTKLRHYKSRNRQLNSFSSSENEIEGDERIQQPRDADTKYRSPFVVIKTGGLISIINTATSEDCSDKNHKLKKTLCYAFDRKNVKGIYSSTLSNKYDADTADSTWICIFCKRGPHRKGLGDLFGPYIISMECDEYKIAADLNVAMSPTFNKDACRSTDNLSSPIIKVRLLQFCLIFTVSEHRV